MDHEPDTGHIAEALHVLLPQETVRRAVVHRRLVGDGDRDVTPDPEMQVRTRHDEPDNRCWPP
jgi:hypothetical protein